MSQTKWGSAYLLQEQEPVELLGICMATTSPESGGWVVGVINRDLLCHEDGHEIGLAFSLDVALRFAALLQVLTSQNIYARGEPIVHPSGEIQTDAFVAEKNPGPKGKVVLTCKLLNDGMTWAEKEGQMEWGLREECAIAVSRVLILAIARASARPD